MTPDPECPNCGFEVGSHEYCAQCGQVQRDVIPTVRALLGQFFDDFLSLDSKLARTLALLVRRPGALTAEYLRGRQTRYVRPLRLYLLSSLFFFLLMSVVGAPDIVNTTGSGAETAPVATETDGAAVGSPTDVADALRRAKLPPETREALGELLRRADADSGWIAAITLDSTRTRRFDDVERWPVVGGMLAAKARKLGDLEPAEFQTAINRSVVAYLPRAIFLLMPVFASLVALVYVRSRRRYAEHFVFALHAHAFTFVAFAVMLVVPWTLVDVMLLLTVVVHLLLALKHVHAQGWLRTATKFVMLLVAYQVLLAGALLATIFVSFLTL